MNRSAWWPLVAFVVVGIASVALGLWLRAIDAPEWTAPDTTQKPAGLHPWAVEADCYSQLARVQRILHGQGLIQNHFTVENWPEGLVPSTTATFDYVILLLWAPLALFTARPLDWAGALVSPALWLVLAIFWALFRSREFTLAGRALLVFGSAVLPTIIWATAFGRPRHQSLILALMAIALTAEYERWQIELTPKRAWNIIAGAAWGFCCWTSLYEPLLVSVLVILFNLAVRRRENPAFLITFGAVMLVALVLEGVHIFVPPPDLQESLTRWLSTIAEMRPLGFAGLVHRQTFIFLLVPWLAWRVWPRENGNRTDSLLVLLTLLLSILAMVQARWIYYASLAELFLLARYFQIKPVHWSRIAVLIIFIVGVADGDIEEIGGRTLAPANQPSVQLLQVSRAIDGPGGIMAPWWLSPGLLYFSGQPIVSGSSHCGISGIVASAQFYASPSWAGAEKILRERKVRWIVAWDDQTVYNGQQFVYPLLNSSRQILGEPAYSDSDSAVAEATVAQVLTEDRDVPRWLHLRGVTSQLKLYEYVPSDR